MNEITKVEDAGDDKSGDAKSENGARRGKTKRKPNRRSPEIFSEEQCASGITQLPGLVLMNMITAVQSNAARGAFNDVLKYHRHSDRGRREGVIADEDVLKIWRQNPEHFRLIENCLTDEQIAMVIKDATDGEEHEA